MRLKCSVIPNNDEPPLLTSSASITPPGQRGYRAHYSSLNLFPNIPCHLSPSPPAPVWDIPPYGRQLILPPSTPAAAVVVSLTIGATAGVGITFGVGRIERGFDVWQLRWVRAAAARRGGDEEDNPDSVMLLDTDVTTSNWAPNPVNVTSSVTLPVNVGIVFTPITSSCLGTTILT